MLILPVDVAAKVPQIVVPINPIVSNKGLLQINFNSKFIVPQYNTTSYNNLVSLLGSNSSLLRLEIIPGNTLEKKLTFTWSIYNLTSDSLFVNLKF